MNALGGYFSGEVAAVRAWIVERGVLLLLALDAWVLMIERGARYGAGGFNVAHFWWLDQVAPLPTPALYVGLLLVIGMLAFVLALTGANRIGLLVLTLLYTYGWATSQLDSYQHHYLVSWLLLAFVVFPKSSARTFVAGSTSPTRVNSWAWVLVLVTCAIMYAYTALAKSESEWTSGAALRTMTARTHPFEGLETWMLGLGLSRDAFWRLLGTSVILVQVGIAVGFLVTAVRDKSPKLWATITCSVALGLALSFHLGAEGIGLRIGWFSWYMILITCAAFLPALWLEWLVRVVTFPGRATLDAIAAGTVRSVKSKSDEKEHDGPWALVLLSLGSALLVGFVCANLDLPGGPVAGIVIGTTLVLVTAVTVGRAPGQARAWIAAAGASALVMWAAIAISGVRYDFYRYLGGDLRRRGELRGAIHAYERAELYAPEGKSRRQRIDAMRHELRVTEGE